MSQLTNDEKKLLIKLAYALLDRAQTLLLTSRARMEQKMIERIGEENYRNSIIKTDDIKVLKWPKL